MKLAILYECKMLYNHTLVEYGNLNRDIWKTASSNWENWEIWVDLSSLDGIPPIKNLILLMELWSANWIYEVNQLNFRILIPVTRTEPFLINGYQTFWTSIGKLLKSKVNQKTRIKLQNSTGQKSYQCVLIVGKIEYFASTCSYE